MIFWGDWLWQKGTTFGATDGPRGTVCGAMDGLGGLSVAAVHGPEGPLMGGTICSMTHSVTRTRTCLDRVMIEAVGIVIRVIRRGKPHEN